MDDQPSNIIQWDGLDKLVRFPPQDGPHGKLGTNGGDYGLTGQLGDAWKSILESESTPMIHNSSVDVAATLPGRFTRSQGSFGSDFGNNQLGAITQNGIGSNQGDKGVGPYIPLFGGPEGSPTYTGVGSNTWGWGKNMLTSPSVADRVSSGVQTMSSLQPLSNSASVHHPGPRNHTGHSFRTTTFPGTGGQASSTEKMNARVTTTPFTLFDDPLMTNLAVDGMKAMPVAFPTSGGLVISSGSQPTTSQDRNRMREEAAPGAYDGGPEHAARGTRTRRTRVPPTATSRPRGPLLPVDPEDNVTKLKARLIEGGAPEEAVDLCDDVFKDGVTREALERRLTHSQCRKLGLRDGKTFQIFLEKVEAMGGMKNRCRLCPRNDAMLYRNHRDGLRHFLKDHFGLSFKCAYCEHKAFTRPELTRHIKILHATIIDV